MKFILFFVSILFIYLNISAHKALLLVEDNEDGTVYIEAGISTGGNAKGNKIYVTELGSGRPIWEGEVPDSGNFDIQMPTVPYIVTLDMGEGHKVTRRGPFPEDKQNNDNNIKQLDIIKKTQDFSEGKVVAVALPPIEKIVRYLVKGTDVQVLNMLGSNSTIHEIDEFIKNNENEFIKNAKVLDAVIGIRSLWPEEKLFNYVRRYNIRCIEIDLASPVDPQTSGVGIKYYDGIPNFNVWHSYTNISKMLEIAATDLSNLFPKEKEQILLNLSNVKKEIFKSKSEMEALLSSIDNVDVAVIGNVFDYILDEAGVFKVISLNEKKSYRKEKDYQKLKDFYSSTENRILIHKWSPVDKKLQEIIKSYNVNVVILEDGMGQLNKDLILETVKKNYTKLYSALKK